MYSSFKGLRGLQEVSVEIKGSLPGYQKGYWEGFNKFQGFLAVLKGIDRVHEKFTGVVEGDKTFHGISVDFWFFQGDR